ncbi:MAG TPA: transcriptional regulator, partial [Acinetobacter nosocomialis]|nr:transcriptional regulator [Acinetobacter nosocomialis]
GKPLEYRHKTCGHKFEPVMVCSVCREPLHAKQVQVSAGPGYFAYMQQKQKQA